MNTSLEHYKIFYYVAKNKNITAAARELHISQPAVSKSIKTLEDELNTQLLNRKNDGVSLTNAGELIFDKIKKSMELIFSAEDDIKGLNNMEYGSINIGAGNTIIQKYLMPYIREFHNIYPNINIQVNTLTTPDLFKKAQDGIIDIVFTHLPNEIPNNFIVVKIKKLHDILVVNNNSEYLNKLITKKDLETMPLILLPLGASNRKSFDTFCNSNNIRIKPLMELGNDAVIEDCAINGLGVGVVAKEYSLDKLKSKELFELKTDFTLGEKDLIYCMDYSKRTNIIIKKFIELLK